MCIIRRSFFFLFVVKFYVEQSEWDRVQLQHLHHFHTTAVHPAAVRCVSLFFSSDKKKKGAASYSAWTKSNFPSHPTAYLTVIIRRVVRAHREIWGGCFRRMKQKILGWFLLQIALPNKHKKTKKTLQTSFEQKKHGDLRGAIQHLCHWEQDSTWIIINLAIKLGALRLNSNNLWI